MLTCRGSEPGLSSLLLLQLPEPPERRRTDDDDGAVSEGQTHRWRYRFGQKNQNNLNGFKLQRAMLPDGGRSRANAARVLGGKGRERHRWSDILSGGSSGDTPSGRDKA